MISYHSRSRTHVIETETEEVYGYDYCEIIKLAAKIVPAILHLTHFSVEIPGPREPVVYVNRSTDAVVSAELLLVVDNMIYRKFGGNVAQISEYYAIFVR